MMPSPSLLNRASRELPLYPCVDQRSSRRGGGDLLLAALSFLFAAALVVALASRW